jgi:hypothetical protein
VELAVATRTAPRDWWDEPDEVLATALDVLEKQAREVKKRGKRR